MSPCRAPVQGRSGQARGGGFSSGVGDHAAAHCAKHGACAVPARRPRRRAAPRPGERADRIQAAAGRPHLVRARKAGSARDGAATTKGGRRPRPPPGRPPQPAACPAPCRPRSTASSHFARGTSPATASARALRPASPTGRSRREGELGNVRGPSAGPDQRLPRPPGRTTRHPHAARTHAAVGASAQELRAAASRPMITDDAITAHDDRPPLDRGEGGARAGRLPRAGRLGQSAARRRGVGKAARERAHPSRHRPLSGARPRAARRPARPAWRARGMPARPVPRSRRPAWRCRGARRRRPR